MTNDDKILKLLGGLATSVATILEEQQSQRIDIRSIHTDVLVLKEDVGTLKKDVKVLKDDVKVLKDDVVILKQDVGIIKQTMATKADVAKKLKLHEQRLDNLEDHTGIPDPTKH